jgi:hypothetical protein
LKTPEGELQFTGVERLSICSSGGGRGQMSPSRCPRKTGKAASKVAGFSWDPSLGRSMLAKQEQLCTFFIDIHSVKK